MKRASLKQDEEEDDMMSPKSILSDPSVIEVKDEEGNIVLQENKKKVDDIGPKKKMAFNVSRSEDRMTEAERRAYTSSDIGRYVLGCLKKLISCST